MHRTQARLDADVSPSPPPPTASPRDMVETRWRAAPSPGGLYGTVLFEAATRWHGPERGSSRPDPRKNVPWLVGLGDELLQVLGARAFDDAAIPAPRGGAALLPVADRVTEDASAAAG
ncbi:hypothetical protein [Spirillospora sp. CA-294931]|uniref:hypothetical protein n=1 Tax=Spirillospora sp. CA-294931 TaxID=3240042 RepID=UPI003D8C948B